MTWCDFTSAGFHKYALSAIHDGAIKGRWCFLAWFIFVVGRTKPVALFLFPYSPTMTCVVRSSFVVGSDRFAISASSTKVSCTLAPKLFAVFQICEFFGISWILKTLVKQMKQFRRIVLRSRDNKSDIHGQYSPSALLPPCRKCGTASRNII